MPPKAPEKKYFDTTNSDDIKEAFHRFLCCISQPDSGAIKELNEQLDKFANQSLKPQARQKKHLDTTNSDDNIKKSFLMFSQTIKELDEELDKFLDGFQRLGHVTGLLIAIKEVQYNLEQTRGRFFQNAVALVPGLHNLAYMECKNEGRGPGTERFHIRVYELVQNAPSFGALPTVLEELAGSFHVLRDRINEFPEFTEQGLFLKDLLSTLKVFLTYRASCAKTYSDRMETAVVQRYLHEFTCDLEINFKKLASALNDFTAIGLPAIRDEKGRAFQSLTNIVAAAALFSGVTASTLQISMAIPDQTHTILVVNALWFMALTLSVGAALNCTFVHLFDITGRTNSGELPSWFRMWMDRSHIFLLGASILTFSAGLSVFTFSSNQASYTPYLIIASMVLASAGLGAIPIGKLYNLYLLVTAAMKKEADAIRSSGDLIHSESKKFSLFSGRIAVWIKNALPWSLPGKMDSPLDDVEQAEEKNDELEESPSQEHDLPDRPKAKLQEGLEFVGITNSALDAVAAASRKDKHGRHGYKEERQLKSKLQSDNSAATVPLTGLILPDEPISKIELGRYGTIRDVSYSDDGKWLGVTCTKENTAQSWTAVFDAETLIVSMDKWHEGRVIAERLKWSPSGKKLILQFERRFDVWDLAANTVEPIDLEWYEAVEDVAWFDDDAFLAAVSFTVIKMDLTGRRTETYSLDDTLIQSIGIERTRNYLILITHVVDCWGQFDFMRALDNKIVVYDMNMRETIYHVPLIGHISCVDPVPGTLDILLSQMDQKAFQLWSLDLDQGSTDRLKPRTIAPHQNPGDYIGPARIGGNHNQFVLNVTKSGNIDIWRRESGEPYRTFSSSILQKEGVGCFSWRRSDDVTATFATAGIGGHTLRIWRGKERQAPETPDSPKFAMNEERRNPLQRAVDEAVASSLALSVPPGAKEVEEIPTENSMKVDPPNSPEVGPSTSNS